MYSTTNTLNKVWPEAGDGVEVIDMSDTFVPSAKRSSWPMFGFGFHWTEGLNADL